MKAFREKVMAITKKIPKGSVMTYGEVARLAGSPGAARAVGSILKTNYDPAIPCHRVIRAHGEIGNYNRGGQKKKTALLRSEGALQEVYDVR